MSKNSLKLVFIIPAIFLLLAPLVKLPYAAYTLLRLVVSVSAGVIIYQSYTSTKVINLTIIIYSIILLIFNPIIPIYFSRSIWLPIDFVVAGIYFYSYFKIIKTIK